MGILRLKHWQLFILNAVISVVGKFLTRIQLVESFDIQFITSAFSTTVYFIWLLSLGRLLFSKKDISIEGKIYWVSFSGVVLVFLTITLARGFFEEVTVKPWLILIIISMLLIALYNLSKNLLKKLHNETFNANKTVQYTFLILFFPLGVWIIQPKINKLMSDLSQPS